MRPFAALRHVALLGLLLILLAGCGLDEDPAPPTSTPIAAITEPAPAAAATATATAAPESLRPNFTATPPPAPTATLPPQGIKVGMTAPDFKFTPQGSETQMRLSDLRGKGVWLNFWYSTCEICVEEMPVIQEVYQEYRDRPVVILGLNTVDPPAKMQYFTDKNGYGWTFAIDRGRATRRAYGVVGIPTHFFIGPDGVIHHVIIGMLGIGEMEELLDEIMGPEAQAR